MTSAGRKSRGGFAMVLVLSAIAIASVLGFAMLSGATLQTRARGNASRAAGAEFLAESGINLAFYYLQNPDLAPALNSSGYWSGTTSAVTIGSGTVSVSVVRDSSDSWTFEVTSTGTLGSVTGTAITRTQYARVYVRNEYKVKNAMAFNGGTTIPSFSSISGNIVCNGTLTMKSNVTYSGGSITASGLSLALGLPQLTYTTIQSYQVPAPSNNDVYQYRTYTVNGTTYNCDTLGVTTLTGTSGVTTLGSSTSNPAGVWYTSGNLTLGDNVKVAGTLVVGGNLVINGAGISVTPKSGYPGLVVIGNLQINQTRKSITVNGVTYVGGSVKTSGVYVLQSDSSTMTINGSLLTGSSSSGISNTFNAAMTILYDATLAKAPDLSSAGRSATGINVLRWGPVVAAPY
ncbi:MAG TPA: hypothetical protein VF669_06015 [Tepidisphaeraceae bacterium]|jgi:hypothetical protein